MTGVDAALFRQLLGRFATGVTVITTRNPAGEPEGMTASSVASVSLEPPLLLVSVDHQNVMRQALAAASHFIVNVLAADQEALSRRFAELEDNRFDGVRYHTGTLGLPILEGVLAHIECTKHAAVEAGDHTLYLGLVTGGSVTDGRPLLYYRGGYANLSGS